jgi:peptidoglycan/LPS O-acetylase OafA/YrhL
MTRYRPEADGLRALAVVPVILFHAGFAAFAGGFVGVDVFFVEEMRGGRFSFGQFFERRARRIIPALYAVIVVTIPLG